MVSPLRREPRCSNCGEVAKNPDEDENVPNWSGSYTKFDQRFALGYCGNCSLRGKVPLIVATRDEVMDIIAERKAKAERKEQVIRLRSGALPNHVYVKGCCDQKEAQHVGQKRLDELWAIMGC